MQFGISSYERARGDLPGLPVENYFSEEAPSEERGLVLQSRPGLASRSADMGSGPVAQVLKRDGVLSGALIGVSGGSLYSGTTLAGAIDGTGFTSIAGNDIGVMTTAGASLWYYNGSALAAVSFPDSADVAHVFTGASRFWAIRKDTGKLYFTPALAATVGALDFVTAESVPDKLLHGLWIDDMAILGGSESIEFWPNTGDSDLPIQPLEGRVIGKGIKATGCMSLIGPTFAFVTNENVICLGDENTIISNPGLEAQIEQSASVSLFRFVLEGAEFLGLRLDDETHAWSIRSRRWSKFSTEGQANWAAQCWDGGVFGSAIDGATLEWGSGHTDYGAAQSVLNRTFRAGFPLNSGGVTINNVSVRVNVGQTPYLTGDYSEPLLEMRISPDAGQTWGNWRSVSLGTQGAYRKKVEWRGLGMASQPGFLAEFRLTAPVDIRVSDVLFNERTGGR